MQTKLYPKFLSVVLFGTFMFLAAILYTEISSRRSVSPRDATVNSGAVVFNLSSSMRNEEQKFGRPEAGRQETGRQEIRRQETGRHEIGIQKTGRQEIGKHETAIISNVYRSKRHHSRLRFKSNRRSKNVPVLETIPQFQHDESKQTTEPGCKDVCSNFDRVDQRYDLDEVKQGKVNATVWQYARPVMTSSERHTLVCVICLYASVCRANNFTHFIISGTLLGSYRHHGLQPWDDDVDILMPITHRKAIFAAFHAYAQSSRELHAGEGPGGRLKISHRINRVPVPISPYKYFWPLVDVSFYHENATHLWQYYRRQGVINPLPKSLVFPLHQRPFENLELPSPRDAFAVLKLLFEDPDCVSLTWSHKFERQFKPIKFKCDQLGSVYPFVFRSVIGDKVQETLMLGNRTVHRMAVKEPLYAISKPFELRLE